MLDQATTPDPILERFKAEAKPPATVEELVVICRDFAMRLIETGPMLASHVLLENLEGRTEAWHDALDDAFRTAEADV